MGCDIDLDETTEHIVLLQSDHNRADRLGRAGDNAGPRTVARRHRYPILQPGKAAAELGHRQIDQRHRTLPADPPHQRAARADHLHGLIEIEHAGDPGGGYFTHAVSDDRIGLDPHRTQQLGVRDRQRDEHRLDHVDTVSRNLAPELRSRQLLA